MKQDNATPRRAKKWVAAIAACLVLLIASAVVVPRYTLVGTKVRLAQAVRSGDVERVRRIVDGNPDAPQWLNEWIPEGLVARLASGSIEGFVRGEGYWWGETPVLLAIERDRPQTLEALLDLGADPDHAAEMRPKKETPRGRRINAVTTLELGSTPLQRASYLGRLACARVLVERGASLEATGQFGIEPLIYACGGISFYEVQYDVAKFLLEMGADPNWRGEEFAEMSLLDLAVFQEDLRLLEMLLRYGASPDAVSPHGESLVELCLKLHDSDFAASVAELVERYAEPAAEPAEPEEER